MPAFELEFEVFCGTCGAGLCNQSDTRSSRQRRMPQVTVEPCTVCLEKQYQSGYDKGYDEGYEEADTKEAAA